MNPLVSNLADAAIGQHYCVSNIVAPPAQQLLATQLEDIGFLPGERVAVMARGQPGSDPLVVRVGMSTFALRRVEAACIQVKPFQARSVSSESSAA